ncbi:hypothetical protein EYF80_027279 [Liparis tanakae]|uniref:Uncharacterized protein n=1 Tax=Liparis tanakae TaxID=230148 RepID=A0A4Z2H9N1_9TELE|nr:hypothetical protein EYF80_027279 [Liparis tanakae]
MHFADKNPCDFVTQNDLPMRLDLRREAARRQVSQSAGSWCMMGAAVWSRAELRVWFPGRRHSVSEN